MTDRLPRTYALTLYAHVDRDAPVPTLAPTLVARLAGMDEDGRVVRRLVGRWCPCPGGNVYEVAE